MAEKMRVRIMGVDHGEVELDPLPPMSVEYHFADIAISPRAIDIASQVVPDKHWLAQGLYTWLQKRASQAFGACAVGENEATIGRLKYIFENVEEVPTLKTVILIH